MTTAIRVTNISDKPVWYSYVGHYGHRRRSIEPNASGYLDKINFSQQNSHTLIGDGHFKEPESDQVPRIYIDAIDLPSLRFEPCQPPENQPATTNNS